MFSDTDVEVIRDIRLLRLPAAADLRAACIEGVEDHHGWCETRRGERRVVGAKLEPKFVEERFLHRTGRRQPEDVLGARLVVAALHEIEIADAEIVVERMVPLELAAQHLRFRKRVLEAS